MALEKAVVQKVIELKLWIFRILSVESGLMVRVEGYRTELSEDDSFITWRSTPIVERYNSHVLFSSSGTKYVLCGVIDEESALSLGYPHTVVRLFKDGFPPDWEILLKRFIKENGIPRKFWLNEVIANNKVRQPTFNTQLPRRHSYAEIGLKEACQDFKEGAVAAMEDKKGASESKVCNVEESANNTTSTLRGPKNMSESVEPNSKRPLRQLCNWTFRFSVRDRGISKLFENFAIVLEGFRIDQGLDWKTSCVVEVKDATHMCTALTDYELLGPMNTALALQQGFPRKFINSFRRGFPNNWHSSINNFFNDFIAPELNELVRNDCSDSSIKIRESNHFDSQIIKEQKDKAKKGRKRKHKWNVK